MYAQFELKRSHSKQFHFVLKAPNGQVIAQSKMYEAKTSALNGIESVRKNAANAGLLDRTGTPTDASELPTAPIEVAPVAETDIEG